jgi:signal transduction histidine kinase
MPIDYRTIESITEIQRQEAWTQGPEALLKTGALQGAIFNSANFSCIATDEKGVIQIFNVGAERMLGFKAADVLNKITPADISDPQELIARAAALSLELGTLITPGFEALVFKASRGIEDIYELTKIRKDGSRFPAIVSVTALRDDQNVIIGYLLIGTDNTARKRAEEALIKAGALQGAIFNSANFSSIATDEKGVIQIFNVGAERMLGYKAADVMNKITPADISDPQEVIARAKALSLELGTPITPGFEALVFKASRGIEDIYELTYIRRDGSRFPAVVSVTALRDDQNAIIGYLLIGTDNTARKQAEAEIRLLSEELGRKEKLAMLGQVAGSVGHELRNPLGVMSNAVYFLQNALPDADESTKEYLNIIKEEIASSERIVSDLLDSARTQPPQLELIDTAKLINQTLRKYTMPPLVTVKLDIPATLSLLRVDPRQIRQVFRNLISNGVEAMLEGGTLEIQASGNRQDKTISISVRDSGSGIAPEIMHNLFQPLFTTKARGIGLGLVVVKNLILANGGAIDVQSTLGKGTVFTVTLPSEGAGS